MEMSMRRGSSSTISMKGLWCVVGLMILVVSSEISVAHCRALRSTASADHNIAAAGCEPVVGAESAGEASPFAVSSNNSSGDPRPSVRNLMFKLASGPSKRGPGH
ncbi:hypothetical protein Tsubulata_034426 [Turnera subulata]|uniref:Uncharacterized protein n=1 Tax=Turnera subulata TaxID=218843 RepID=A0A9Q0F0Q9_9ROSI|nr:hypothetical protein Tsubulata_034426 [Turnera subulata]